MPLPAALSTHDFLSTIRSLYDAAIDSAKWPTFLQQLAAAFTAQGAHIARVQPRDQTLNFSALYGYDDAILARYGEGRSADIGAALARYEKHFMELMPTDPRVRLLERFPYRPLSCRLEISESELHGSKMYQDMLRVADIEYSLIVSMAEEDGSLIMLGVFRDRQSRYFDRTEVELFSALIPHVKQAVALSEHLTQLQFSSEAAFAALDSMSVGVLIVDQAIRLVHANEAGQRIITLADGMKAVSGALVLDDQQKDAELRGIVRSVLSAPFDQTSPVEMIAVPRRSGREAICLMIGPLRHSSTDGPYRPLGRPLAILTVSLPEEPQEAPAELLRRLFGLTAAEARVCERVVQGRSVEEISTDLKVARDTVRVHLKSIYAKTETRRQAELVAKIMSSPIWANSCRGHNPRTDRSKS